MIFLRVNAVSIWQDFKGIYKEKLNMITIDKAKKIGLHACIDNIEELWKEID